MNKVIIRAIFSVVITMATINAFGQTADEYYRFGIAKMNKASSFLYSGDEDKKNQVPKIRDSAIYDFDQAIKLNPQFAKAYHLRGEVFTDICQYKKAVSDVTIAIGINPKVSEYYLARAIAYTYIDFPLALADLDKVSEIEKGNGRISLTEVQTSSIAGGIATARASGKKFMKRNVKR